MQVSDIVEIVNVVNLYAMALDSHQYSLFERVFTEHVSVDFGAGAAFTGLKTLQAGFEMVHAGFSSTQHITSGHVVLGNGDDAHCGSYVRALFRRKLEDGEVVFDSTGWYDDTLVRTPAGWRIARRVSRMVSASGDVRVMQAMPDAPASFDLVSLASEVEGGRVNFLKAAAG